MTIELFRVVQYLVNRDSVETCQVLTEPMVFRSRREFNPLNCRVVNAVISDFLLCDPNHFPHALLFRLKQRMVK